MQFHWNGSTIHLHGITNNKVSEISQTQLKGLQDPKAVSGYYHLAISPILLSDYTNLSNIPNEVVSLVHNFKELFQEPQELPSVRSNTHHIKLLPASTLVNVRPYRYPFFQKKKKDIEKFIEEMLSSGTT